MELIKKRTNILRSELDKIESNRAKLDYLKNYYLNKTAIIIATGPNFIDYTDLIKNNINENTIIICIKQSLYSFDNISDFHLLNYDNLDTYNYIDFKPITLFTNYNKERTVHPYGDINFFIHPPKDIIKENNDIFNGIDNNKDYFSFNDNNLGIGESMTSNFGHIMFELAIPLCIQLGIKNIILNGWVGGYNHGIHINNELKWVGKYDYLQEQLNNHVIISEKIPQFLYTNFNIHIYSICPTMYKIDQIFEKEYLLIINSKNLIVIYLNETYDVGGLVRYLIKMFNDFEISQLFLKNGLKIITSKNIMNCHYLINTENEFIKFVNNSTIFNNSILLGIHPYGFEYIYKYSNLNYLKEKNIKYVGWHNDPHYFAHFVADVKIKNTTVQLYSEKYDPLYISNMDYLISPSLQYFKNLHIESYNDKFIDLFYILNKNQYELINYNNYNLRLNKIVLSGCIGNINSYKTRFQFIKLKLLSDQFNNLIDIISHPGYINNDLMTELNYYNELSKYKAAFVGHHIFPINFLLAKHIEVLMCGCLGFFEKNDLLFSQLGLIEFVHYIPCTNESNDVINNYDFYINYINSDKGKEIAKTGCEYVRNKFGFNYIQTYIDTFNSMFL
jgi:hypothetical protein